MSLHACLQLMLILSMMPTLQESSLSATDVDSEYDVDFARVINPPPSQAALMSNPKLLENENDSQ